MRLLIATTLLAPMIAWAQPDPPSISITLAAELEVPTPLTASFRVEQHFRYEANYSYEPQLSGTARHFLLAGTPMFRDTSAGWQQFILSGCWCTDLRVLVISANDTMTLDLPEERWPLIQRAMRRWHKETPEVIRFRPGRYRFDQVIAEPLAEKRTKEFAERLKTDEQLEELFRYQVANVPRDPPVKPKEPMIGQSEWERRSARPGGITEVVLQYTALAMADTQGVTITGHVMLDGSCASAMPLSALERMENGTWRTFIPMPTVQMDCGAPDARWREHVWLIDLSWKAKQQRVTWDTGTYRFVFRGADGSLTTTEPFDVLL